jgi:hypothetical protein
MRASFWRRRSLNAVRITDNPSCFSFVSSARYALAGAMTANAPTGMDVQPSPFTHGDGLGSARRQSATVGNRDQAIGDSL